MHIKKKYRKIISMLVILAIFINITAIIPVKNAGAEEAEGVAETTEEAGMVLYKAGKAEGEYISLEDALNAMTDQKGDYEIVFNKNNEEYTLYGDIELPEVSSIKLSGVYEMYEKDGSMTQYLTKINVNSNIYINSDLIMENININYNNETQNSIMMLNEHTLTMQGEENIIISSNGINRLQITGGDGSCLVVNDTTYNHYSDITVGTIILKNGALMGCFGNFNKIQNLFSYSNEPAKYNRIYFNCGLYYDTYSSIGNIEIYAPFSLGIFSCTRMDIGSIKQYTDIDSVDIDVDYYKYRADSYCHLNIKGDINAELRIRCSLQEFSGRDYKMFRDISHLCAPNVPVSKINYIFDCKEHPEWKAGDVFKDIEGNIWFEPVEEKEEEALCYKLDEQSRDRQKIFYSLDTENKTAVVGKDSDVLNTAGYKGANNGCVIIPSYVEKDGIKYIVTRIGSNSFANGISITRMEFPDTVKSIGKKAFWRTGIDEIYIGSGLESIGEDAFLTYINRIYVDPANQHFLSYKNVLFDIECETLIKCSSNYSFFDDGCYIVPYPVRTIADGAFKETYVKNIILAGSVTVIGKEAFSNCFYLESFSGNQVEEIKEMAFSGCRNLRYVNVGTNIKRIGTEIFSECNSLEWLLFPDSKMVIEDKAFWNIRNLKYFIGAKNAEYGIKLFGDCEKLSLVSLSEYMENIPEGLFAGCSSLEKIYIPEQCTGCALSAFTGNVYKNCTAYGTDEQKKFLTKAFVNFENKSEHEHIMVTEIISEPGERTYGAEVTYCTYCHYIEEGKLIPPTGTQVTIPTISRPVLKTPAPVANETPELGTSVTPVPEETPEPGNTLEPPSSSKPPEDNNTGSNSGGSSGGGGGGSSSGGGASAGGGGFGGGGGAGAAGGSQPAATQTPVPSEPPSSQPVSSSKTPQATPGVTIPAAEPSQAPLPSPSPGLDNTYGRIEIYSFSLKLDKNNHAKLKWNKNPDAAGYIIYRSTKRNKNFSKIHTIKNPSKNFYTDKKVSPGKRYYYRISAYRLYGKIQYTGGYSSIQNIKTLYLIKPKIKAAKGKTAGNIKYIQLDLKKYSGTDIAVYIRGSNKKYKRLELIESSIKKYNASFKLRYNSKKKNCYIKVKTFINKNGQKYYSAYSNIAKVKM